MRHAYVEGEGGEPDGENGKHQLQFLHLRYHHQPPPALDVVLKNGGFFYEPELVDVAEAPVGVWELVELVGGGGEGLKQRSEVAAVGDSETIEGAAEEEDEEAEKHDEAEGDGGEAVAKCVFKVDDEGDA